MTQTWPVYYKSKEVLTILLVDQAVQKIYPEETHTQSNRRTDRQEMIDVYEEARDILHFTN